MYVGGDIVANKLTIQLTTVTTTNVTTDDIISTYNTTNATSTVTGALVVTGGAGIGLDLWVGGGLYATTKSFLIPHPTRPGMKLRYGSLEGPENGVYVRGRLTGSNIIELPDYWTALVDPKSITVTLTPIGCASTYYVKEIIDNTVIIAGSRKMDCYFVVWAERKDVGKLDVEIAG